MSFDVTVSGGSKLKPFLQLLSTATKLAESIFFEPTPAALLLRGINESKSVHFLAAIPLSFFESYSHSNHANGQPLNLQVSSKAVALSILRYCPSLSRLALSHDPAVAQDTFTASLFCQSGTRKTFHLHIGEQTTSEKADLIALNNQLGFSAVAEPRAWASLFSQFSNSVRTITIQPSAHRLVMYERETTGLDDAIESGGGQAVVSVDSKTFSPFVFPTLSTPEEPKGRLSTASVNGPNSSNAAVGGGQLSLPGKTVEFKPMKWFSLIAESLNVGVKLATGSEGDPVLLEGVKRGSVDPLVTHVSLLLAATDSGAPSSHVAPPPPRPSADANALQRQQSSIRSVSQFNAPLDSIVSASHPPGESPRGGTASSGVLQPSSAPPVRHATHADPAILAVASAARLPTRTASEFSVVAPSFDQYIVETPESVRKRQREDYDYMQGTVVPGSGDRSVDHSVSFVRSSTENTTSAVPGTKSALHEAFPLDFDALMSDDDDDIDNVLEHFLAERCGNVATTAPPPGRATSGVAVDFASALLMMQGTQFS